MKRPDRERLPRNCLCLDCGKKMTSTAAKRAVYGDKGCPQCGSADIDLYSTKT